MQLPYDSSQPGAPGYAAPPPAQGGGNKTIIIVVVVVLLLCCCCAAAGLGYWLFQNGDELMRQINSSSKVPWGMLPLA
jgi:flagellar basal body-associated protein FliL